MSYILDALRKADAQRQRDPARGIHAQPLRGAGGQPLPRNTYGPWLWGGAAVGVAALSWGGWYLYRDSGVGGSPSARVELAARAPAPEPAVGVPAPAPVVGNPVVPAPIAPPPIVPAPVAPAPVPANGIDATAPSPAPMVRSLNQQPDPRASSLPTMRGGPQPEPAQREPANPSPLAAPAVIAPNPPVASAPAPAFVTQSAPLAPAQPDATAARQAAAATPAQPAANTPATGLPPDAPKLVISGGVYSPNRAQRMLIVNGQVFNEGSEVVPEVVVEEIKARTAVLRFRGARYAVTY